KIGSVADLQRAAAEGRIGTLPGFGTKTEQLIREGIERLVGGAGRLKLWAAEHTASALVAHLEACKGVKDVVVAGSYRRRKETVGDLDILVTATKAEPLMERFTTYGEVAEVLSKGSTRSTVRLRSGLQVDLRV